MWMGVLPVCWSLANSMLSWFSFCAKHVLEWVGGGYFPGFSFSKNNQVFVQGQKHLRRKIMWNIICFSHFLLVSLTIEEWSFYLLSSKCWIWCLYHCFSWRGRMEWYHPCLIVFNFSVMLFGTHKNLDHPTNQRCLYRMTVLTVTLRMLACYFAAWSTEVISIFFSKKYVSQIRRLAYFHWPT